jgi:hypothetical protein
MFTDFSPQTPQTGLVPAKAGFEMTVCLLCYIEESAAMDLTEK